MLSVKSPEGERKVERIDCLGEIRPVLKDEKDGGEG